jgi:hypothetical protein
MRNFIICSSVGIATDYVLDYRGSIPGGGWEFFSATPCPERLWGPPTLLSNEYQGLLPCWSSGRGVKLTTHLHLVPRSRMRGAIPPLLHYVFMAWCLVKRRDNFTFILLLFVPVAARSEARTVFNRSNTGIVGWNLP